MQNITKNTEFFPLEGGRRITQSKGKDHIGKGPPRTCEGGIIQILRVDIDLTIPTETIQELKELLPHKTIQHLINKR